MVDFNSEGAFSANKSHILELVILGRRDELINTFQSWKEFSLANTSKADGLKYKLHSVISALFLELDRTLSRKLDKDAYELMKSKLLGDEVLTNEEVNKYFFEINTALDSLNLIKIDNKKKYDSTDIESENEQKGI
jgi:hypothetical protein